MLTLASCWLRQATASAFSGLPANMYALHLSSLQQTNSLDMCCALPAQLCQSFVPPRRWDASNGNQGAAAYYLNAMDALYKVLLQLSTVFGQIAHMYCSLLLKMPLMPGALPAVLLQLQGTAEQSRSAATPACCSMLDGDAQVYPTTLFLVEGTGQQNSGAICWGDGFVIDQEYLQKYGGSSPVAFFNELLTRPYLQNVVIAPHYYGPSISKATAG